MATSTRQTPSGNLMNVPNQLTSARLGVSIVLFVFLALGWYGTSLVVFIIGAGTDWIDGYWARKYGQVTVLGRILDPFADKIIVCGTFIFLTAVPQSGAAAWMTVVIVGRELLVTALRSFLEERGADFSANMAGKLKMVVQCAAIVASLGLLTHLVPNASSLAANSPDVWQAAPPDWLRWTVAGLMWGAVAITVYSGVGYIFAAIRLMRR